MNENYKIFRPLLIHSNNLYASHRINTIYNYLSKVVRFLNYLESKDMEYDEVTESTIVSYINYLQGYEEGIISIDRKLAGSTINTHLTAIAGFYETLESHQLSNGLESPFLYTEGFRPRDMHKGFLYHADKYKRKVKKRKIKANDKHSNNLNKSRRRKSKTEIDIFRSQISNERDLLIFDILYNTGMRISELLNLQIYDYSTPGADGWGIIEIIDRDISEFTSINIAKNRQAKTGGRQIPVYNELLERIEEYVLNKRPYIDDELFIFVSHKGEKGTPITKDSVQKMFRAISEKSGIKITPHMLRHTHITELTESGFDPLYISIRAGHSSFESTSKYQHPSIESQAEALLRVRPGVDIYE